MDAVIKNELTVDHILLFMTLRDKLRLRSMNQRMQGMVESWLRRRLRTLIWDGTFSIDQMIKLIELSSERPKLMKLDRAIGRRVLSQRFWPAIKDRFMNADKIDVNTQRIDFLT